MMKISLNWLSDYITNPFTPKELEERLTMLGIEVEHVEDFGRKFDKIVVGEVLEVAPHPNADKLQLAKVSLGNGAPLNIVCGAPNVRAGLKVAVATIGANLGEGFVIKKSKIRGETSEGMLCSQKELGISGDHNGIWELPNDLAIGTPLAKAIGKEDIIFEIGVTPNRADCLSHIGIAREIAAITKNEIQIPTVASSEALESIGPVRVRLSDPDLCPRYAAKVVTGVRIGPSPIWLRTRLEAVGLRSVNNVVDVTNFVLMECGHPLHAFDLDSIAGSEIIVRRARDFATSFKTLDGKDRKLDPEMLLISDAEKPLAIAGVMGGMNSEITSETKNILIESAYFTPASIRRTSRLLGLSTDASYRFERGTDYDNVLYAVERAAALINELAGGTVVEGTIDNYPNIIQQRAFTFRPINAIKLIGCEVDSKEMEDIFQLLNISVEKSSEDAWTLTPPSYRVDLETEADAIEEIARMIGYDSIPANENLTIVLPGKRAQLTETDFDTELRRTLIDFGFSECVSTPLVQGKQARQLAGDTAIELINPLNSEKDFMRPSLLVGLLEAQNHNERFGADSLRLFELGTVFHYSNDSSNTLASVAESRELALIISGEQEPKNPYNASAAIADRFHIIGIVRNLLLRTGLQNISFANTKDETLEAAQMIEWQNKPIGRVGEISKTLRQSFDLSSPSFAAVIDVSVLFERMKKHRTDPFVVSPLPIYPSVSRDLAFVVPGKVTALELQQSISGQVPTELFEGLHLFDQFQSPEMKRTGERSLAFHLVFRSRDRTLEESSVDEIIQKIVADLKTKFHASLRV